jgi:hypothetical protein
LSQYRLSCSLLQNCICNSISYVNGKVSHSGCSTGPYEVLTYLLNIICMTDSSSLISLPSSLSLSLPSFSPSLLSPSQVYGCQRRSPLVRHNSGLVQQRSRMGSVLHSQHSLQSRFGHVGSLGPRAPPTECGGARVFPSPGHHCLAPIPPGFAFGARAGSPPTASDQS